MANSDYTYTQVVNGNGSYSKSGDTGYASGVATLQTYLKKIGYTISDTSGRFQSTTYSAVKNFQYELGITQDGVAGQATCIRLKAVYSSEYYNTYGKPLSDSAWGRDNILAGNFDDVDLLARIILAESGYSNTSDEEGVALVIKNRSVNTSSTYWASSTTYPNASIYARVVGKASQYDTAKSGNEIAQTPRRGLKGTESDGFIDPAWKNAVELAKDIVDGAKITATGYTVSGTNINIGAKKSVNSSSNKDYLNQTAWSLYSSYYSNGKVSSSVKPITFSTSADSNVIYKM